MSVWIVPPVSCSVFFIFLYSLFSNIELYYENSKNIMKASILTSILNLILNFVFIKFFGYVAAAYTTLVCYIFLSLLHYIYMKKVLKEENVKEHPYNLEAILIISFIIIGYSILITFTYSKSWILRYTIIIELYPSFAKILLSEPPPITFSSDFIPIPS